MTELPHDIDLDNPEFQIAQRLLTDTDSNIFLTGKAGSGKSTFLRYICNNIKKKFVVLAPTGVAAVNVGGMTIHSFFQMPLRPVPPDDPDYSVASFRSSKKISRRKLKLIKELELIIIDEVSMVRADMIDFIDRSLRGITGRRGKPFGGIQLLLVGDIFQLEPVVTPDTRLILSKYYPDFFFFNAKAYDSANLISVELKKIYRQTDRQFIDMLDRVRLNLATPQDFKMLNGRIDNDQAAEQEGKEADEEKIGIILSARRDTAAAINKEKMESLPGEEFIFRGEIENDFPERILPTDLNLVLKENAQVMMIRNDKDRRWVNGTLARIKEISKSSVTIVLENGQEEKVERETWENITYSYDEKEKKVVEEVIGSFTQYPLRAAWALTIHKSQGLTFNDVTIDMAGGAFSAGQTYVALSRCRSLEGLRFVNPLRRTDVFVNRVAAQFSKGFNDREAAEMAMKRAEAARLSAVASEMFSKGDFPEAVETVWKINASTGALGRKGVRRLIARKLSVVASLREELEQKNGILKRFADEFVELGYITLNESSDPESAMRNFSKAAEIDPGNADAMLGMAECMDKTGKETEAIKLLDKIKKVDKETAYRVYMLKGSIYEKGEEMSKAALNYVAASKKKKDERLPIERLAELYEKAGLDDEAEQYRKMLRERFP